MPLMKYFGYVGSALLILMIGIGLWFPQLRPDPVGNDSERPAIRISSVEHPPERVVIDTSLPTIMPHQSEHDTPAVVASELNQLRSLEAVDKQSITPAPKAVVLATKTKQLAKRESKKRFVAHHNEPPLNITPSPQQHAASEARMSLLETFKERVGQLSLLLDKRAH